ncbi:phage integrase N-terminal SAM-like domain-containing protein [Roseobacter fucihabitans]|uniref:phage integrase N-terminal SAM-like domain-containing protein n=1 Tax=Roseobacter fucihabitans TaxID=1537242 RepID=UPI0016530A13|nr:phage integrase N-terminal SAM-like domain-containing protein [Roseobacter litoralis]
MQIKGLQPKTQTMYLRGMRDFTRFLGRSPDTATPEDLRAFQLDMKERGVGGYAKPVSRPRLSLRNATKASKTIRTR